jgi:hypothetical protein
MFDAALEKMMGELDDVEGSSAMSHSQDECPDPLTCGQHDAEQAHSLSPGGDGVTIEVKKMGLPSLDGSKEEEGEGSEGLSPEEADQLRKLLK